MCGVALVGGLTAMGAIATDASAQPAWDVALGVGTSISNEPNPHGWGVLRYRRPDLRVPYYLELHSDTLTVAIEGWRPSVGSGWSFGAHARGEYGAAGLLMSHYQRAVLYEDRAFVASYLQAQLSAKHEWAGGFSLETSLRLRQWIVEPNGSASPDLLPPGNPLAASLWLHLVYWRADGLGSSWDVMDRVDGFAAGLTVGLEVRDEYAEWGADIPESPRSARNDPAPPILMLRPWARWGTSLGAVGVTEVRVRAALGFGEDDLTRDRIGGQNPFSVPLTGLAWAGLISERYAALQWLLGVETRTATVGPFVDALVVSDIERTGATDLTATAGVGAFVDARLGPWQLAVRGGILIPADWQQRGPHGGASVAIGRTFE